MKLGDFLQAKDITAAEFGKLIGVSKVSVHRYCRFARVPKPTIMRVIVEKTGGDVTPNDFHAVEPPADLAGATP